MAKIYISARELLEDSFRLAAQVFESRFRPDFIIGIWRGGAPIGIAVQEYFDFKGIHVDHIAVRTSSYEGIDERSGTIKVHGLKYIVDNIRADNSLLVVDDAFDTGCSIKALLERLAERTGTEMPRAIKIACPWYKPANNKTDIEPHYFLHETDKWLVFPHELSGLTMEEIRRGKPDLSDILYLFD